MEEESQVETPITAISIIDLKELEPQASVKDAANQAFLQGFPTVTIPVTVEHEASQTMYMSSPCPPARYSQNILRKREREKKLGIHTYIG